MTPFSSVMIALVKRPVNSKNRLEARLLYEPWNSHSSFKILFPSGTLKFKILAPQNLFLSATSKGALYSFTFRKSGFA